MRILFGKPIRKETTEIFFSEKISLEDFRKYVSQSVNPFCDNMSTLGGKSLEDKFIEEWFEQFLCWNEVETE